MASLSQSHHKLVLCCAGELNTDTHLPLLLRASPQQHVDTLERSPRLHTVKTRAGLSQTPQQVQQGPTPLQERHCLLQVSLLLLRAVLQQVQGEVGAAAQPVH